ncbi:MAG: protein-methionine-sulfoxide reductase catalytic subunit MsrP [Spirochaetaceae bacterium]|nr:protein-methionine-sulfoxide reductase catalytic subunit MsrP [Myxococcales bacterium]MCB9724167.1 protein-methionine-sulfoxide reductase catalytic subunit MsrP [Spirochaetaceae bacterium]HPG24942.1 protein-methionine-sulfoxide reductase catalytic subunit MsrP [Myxococcota bacterium]
MKIPEPRESEVTDEAVFLNRREVLRLGAAAALGTLVAGCPEGGQADPPDPLALRRLPDVAPAAPAFRVDEEPTSFEDVTSYNNFYEFGTGKQDPAREAHTLRPEPWSVVVDGDVGRPGRVPLEDLLAAAPLEERIYRFRCVEAWSMVVPWIGVPLARVIERFQPGPKAAYVAFETLVDPEQMPGQRRRVIDWPYREGLRMDEAMHPLAFLAIGLYGRVLPNQNGAPIRLVVPWKYGFKSIKSIVRMSFTEKQPHTSWNDLQPSEYGFYANVNPEVDHPRWSQARERRLGEFRKRPTLPFNGYAEQVAGLYAGLDLRRNF